MYFFFIENKDATLLMVLPSALAATQANPNLKPKYRNTQQTEDQKKAKWNEIETFIVHVEVSSNTKLSL